MQLWDKWPKCFSDHNDRNVPAKRKTGSDSAWRQLLEASAARESKQFLHTPDLNEFVKLPNNPFRNQNAAPCFPNQCLAEFLQDAI